MQIKRELSIAKSTAAWRWKDGNKMKEFYSTLPRTVRGRPIPLRNRMKEGHKSFQGPSRTVTILIAELMKWLHMISPTKGKTVKKIFTAAERRGRRSSTKDNHRYQPVVTGNAGVKVAILNLDTCFYQGEHIIIGWIEELFEKGTGVPSRSPLADSEADKCGSATVGPITPGGLIFNFSSFATPNESANPHCTRPSLAI